MNTVAIAESFPAPPDARHPAYAESTAHLTDLLRGFVCRWETVDFSVSANCFEIEQRMQAWDDANLADLLLPSGYERQ